MKQNLCWDYFAFIWTQLIEVVMWQAQYAETTGWGLCLGYRISAYGQVLGWVVPCLELGFGLQFT